MRLYLDDDSIARALVRQLKNAGHDIEVPAEVQLSSAKDPLHLTHAIRSNRTLLTHNYDDFEQLHALIVAAMGSHAGIIIIRRDSDKRDLKPAGIVKAIENLQASGNPIRGQLVILNHYR